MTTRQQLAADGGIFSEATAAQFLKFNRGFVVVQLTDEIVAIGDGGPAEKRIGLPLHGMLALRHTLTLMCRGVGGGAMDGEIWRIGRAGLFLYLQEERVVFTVAFEIDKIIAQTDAAGTDDFECNIDGHVLVEEVAALRREAVAVSRKAGEHGARLREW